MFVEFTAMHSFTSPSTVWSPLRRFSQNWRLLRPSWMFCTDFHRTENYSDLHGGFAPIFTELKITQTFMKVLRRFSQNWKLFKPSWKFCAYFHWTENYSDLHGSFLNQILSKSNYQYRKEGSVTFSPAIKYGSH